jgi:hypothetical protein
MRSDPVYSREPRRLGEIIDFIATTDSPLGEILSGGLRHNGDGTLSNSTTKETMKKAQTQIIDQSPLTAEEKAELRKELAEDLAWGTTTTETESNVFDSSHCNGTEYQS